MRASEVQATDLLIARLQIFPVTAAVAKRAGSLKMMAARHGRTFGLDDMIVAATAWTHGLVLLTDNRKDFEWVKGLQLFRADF